MRTRLTLLSCALVAGAGAPALAASGGPAALLGGGAIGPTPGDVEQLRNVLVSVHRSGDRLELSAHTYARCGGTVTGLTLAAGAEDGDDFDVRRSVELPSGRRATLRLRSPELTDRSATGTLEVRGGGCRAATSRWAIAAPAATAPAPTRALLGARQYVGDTGARRNLTRRSPIVLRTSTDGRGLSHVLYAVGMRCTPPGTYRFGESLGPVTLKGGGTFEAGNREVLRENDGTTTRRVTFTGQARGSELSASLRVRVRVTAPGRRTRTCDTGTLRFRAVAVPLP